MSDLKRQCFFPGEMTSDQISETPLLVKGDGIYLTDKNGKTYLDAISGIAVTGVGYGRKAITAAMAKQADQLPYCISNIFITAAPLELADKLAAMAPSDLNHVNFTSGGSESVETAIKLARQYHLETGNDKKWRIIARKQSYHGATLGALAATGMAKRREACRPLLADFPHINPCYCFRCPYELTHPDCNVRCARELEDAILTAGPETVSAFIAEPVVGSACGATVPPDDYFPVIRKICDTYNVLFIADEVISGMGRTGKNFAMEHWHTTPDMIAVSKSLSGGYSPLGAVIVSDNIRSAFYEEKRLFEHIFTYAANPISTTAALKVLEIMEAENLVERARDMGRYLFKQMAALTRHAMVGDIRGKGLLMGIELIRDKNGNLPFDPGVAAGKKLGRIALEKGLVIYPGSGSVDGVSGDHFLICPPFIITRDQCDTIVELLDASLGELSKQV